MMEQSKGKANYVLHMKSVTWYKDSHSLFDYESTKISSASFTFPLSTKEVTLYRKRAAFNVIAVDERTESNFDPEEYQFLTKMEVRPTSNSKIRINFCNDTEKRLRKINSDRINTDQSISSASQKEEETYLIVKKLLDHNGAPKGYRLEPGQTIKLGRVEYFVREISIDGQVNTSKGGKAGANFSKDVLRYVSHQEIEDEPRSCKICMEETDEGDNFLFNPCKCSGSCGTVHFECLKQWIHVKVRKEVLGGTLHYNFEKFECQVCKTELPASVEANGRIREFLPIDKPEGNYLILQAACEKSKSVMMIRNVPAQGIKLGRGHDCEIRITDISVSRNHANIKCVEEGFVLYDNKSKFGTLVKEQKMSIELGNRSSQGIQVGRTVVTFDIRKDPPGPKEDYRNIESRDCSRKLIADRNYKNQ